jgi:hypothetical protein
MTTNTTPKVTIKIDELIKELRYHVGRTFGSIRCK